MCHVDRSTTPADELRRGATVGVFPGRRGCAQLRTQQLAAQPGGQQGQRRWAALSILRIVTGCLGSFHQLVLGGLQLCGMRLMTTLAGPGDVSFTAFATYLMRSCAGALELMPVHSARNLPKTLAAAAAAGWQVLGAHGRRHSAAAQNMSRATSALAVATHVAYCFMVQSCRQMLLPVLASTS